MANLKPILRIPLSIMLEVGDVHFRHEGTSKTFHFTSYLPQILIQFQIQVQIFPILFQKVPEGSKSFQNFPKVNKQTRFKASENPVRLKQIVMSRVL